MMTKLITILIVFTLIPAFLEAQEAKLELGAYIDTYIATDNDGGNDTLYGQRMLSYVNMKENDFSINTAQITAKVTIDRLLRSNFTLHTGDLHKTAWVNAGTSMPMIQQANIGLNIYEKFWIDAGYFLTHIGGESLLPKDNWLSSHSLVTFYEPFYQAGIRASYESDDINAQIHLLNGNGIFDDNNFNKTLGLFLSYKPADMFLVSYAGVIGNEEAGAPFNSKLHMLHNIVAQFNATDEFTLKAQADIGSKENAVIDTLNNTQKNGSFTGFSLTGHYQFTKPFSITARFAYADNSDGIYSPVLKGMDFTLGAEYKPSDNSYVRLEGRAINLSEDYKLFMNKSEASSTRLELALNVGIWIN